MKRTYFENTVAATTAAVLNITTSGTVYANTSRGMVKLDSLYNKRIPMVHVDVFDHQVTVWREGNDVKILEHPTEGDSQDRRKAPAITGLAIRRLFPQRSRLHVPGVARPERQIAKSREQNRADVMAAIERGAHKAQTTPPRRDADGHGVMGK